MTRRRYTATDDRLLRQSYSNRGAVVPRVTDLIFQLRHRFGVEITYDRHGVATGGEYSIGDWGLFDRSHVLHGV